LNYRPGTQTGLSKPYYLIKNQKMEYNKKYYNDIWTRILSKYSVDSPVRDLGDVSRAYHVGKYLEKTIRLCKSKEKVVIHDYGAGNWLYLGEILRVLKLFKQQKFILVGNDFSQEALDFGIEKYRKQIPANVEIQTRSGDFAKHLYDTETGSVDIVISLETLEHVYEDEKIFSELVRILVLDGFLIVSVPTKQPFWLSKNWFLYVLANKRFTEKDRIVGHLRRYTTKTFSDLNKGRLSRLDGSFYGFLLSDYLKDILKVFREGSMAHEFIFNLAKRLLLVEDGFFNYLGIKRSEGMFNVYRKI